jgi:phosphate/phosphite/phosphonate ABC transporter binding protein
MKKIFIILLFVSLLFGASPPGLVRAEDNPLKIGVLAKRGHELCQEEWDPLAEYLSNRISDKTFIIVPLGYNQILDSVKNGKIDFVLTNPSSYIELEHFYGANRIATLKNACVEGVCTRYGGVIFRKADREDIKRLDDLLGKTFMAVDEKSLGGWQAAWRKLKEKGIDPYHDFKELRFGGTQDAVIYAVRDGIVDAGSVRTNTLEQMHAEGKVDLKNFYVFCKEGAKFGHLPCMSSTRLYPEWPMARVKHVSDELAEEVAVALLKMPEDSPVPIAGRLVGWTIPLNYRSVNECLKELKIGPYKHLGEIALVDVFRTYKYWILVGFILVLIMGGSIILILNLNQRLNMSHIELQSELNERKRAQEISRENELKFRAVYEQTFQLMGMTEVDGTVISVNKTALDIVGVKESDFVGTPLWESRWFSYSSELRDQLRDSIKRAAAGQFIRFEGKLGLPSGAIQDTDYSIKPVKNEEGKVVLLIHEGRDISNRKRIEEELREAKEKAEIATQAKNSFLANMSHEIRTPMNGIIAASDLALKETVPEKLEHYLQIIHSSAYSLLGIINDILDVSKIEAGKLDLEMHPFQLDDVVDTVIDMFLNRATEKTVEILVDIDPEMSRSLIGDSLRLQQVLVNLMSNAVKFTEKGGIILLGVSEHEKSTDKTTLDFFLKDTGVGIPPDYIKRIFEPFSQADASITRHYGGSGLGLCISKQLVEMMDGEIEVESEPGVGSTFRFTARFDRRPEEITQKLVLPADIQGLTVLVVDDCVDSRTIMKKMLESFGFHVEMAGSGGESLKRLEDSEMRENPVDLVMMDCLMPEMNGIEASRIIRTEMNLHIPIILMTAFRRESEMLYSDKVGINGFLIKPIYQSTLFDAIMDTFGKKDVKSAKPRKHITTRTSIYKNRLRGVRILVAEDNPTNQEIALAILEGVGSLAEIANNGKEAVEAVHRSHYDAVLMDIQMPVMDGYEATRAIRKDPKFVSLPIIAMTAHAMKGDEEKCREAGMDGYISKPVNQDRLFQVLWRVLKTRIEPPRIQDIEPDGAGPETKELSGYLPAKLPGIDIQEALNNLNLDNDTFKRILEGFLRNNQDTRNKIRDAFDKNDWAVLLRLAHNLKGSGANIGAGNLHRSVEALEKACKDKKTAGVISPLVDSVETALNQVLGSIQSLVETPNIDPLSGKKSGMDLAQLKPALEQLAEALELADPEKINERAKAVKVHLDVSNFQNIGKLINNYDYDEALEVLNKILGNLGE